MTRRAFILTLLISILPLFSFAQNFKTLSPDELQKQSDNEAFVEWSVRFGDYPSSIIRDRTFQRALDGDNVSMYWIAELKRQNLLPPDQAQSVDLQKFYEQSTRGFSPGIASLAQLSFDRGQVDDALASFRSLEKSGCKLCLQVTGEFYARPGDHQNLDKAAAALLKAEGLGNFKARHDLLAVYEAQNDAKQLADSADKAFFYCDPEITLKKFNQLSQTAPDDPKTLALYARMLAIGKEKFQRQWESDADIQSKIKNLPDNQLLLGLLNNNPAQIRTLALKDKKDIHLNRILLFRAESLGDPIAAALLAEARVSGNFGTIKRPDLGMTQLESGAAATPPNSEMLWLLGRLLAEGKYISKNPARAQTLIQQAAALGQPDAADWLSKAAK